jgi:hypothetical protein
VTDELIGVYWHWQVGILRRPDMDDANGYCYEEPDGDLLYTPYRRHEKAMRLCLWRASDGERYTTLSKCAPPTYPKFARG